MNSYRILRGIALALVAASLAASTMHAQETQPAFSITDPAQDGTEVGLSKLVKGSATIPSGQHVWILVRREDFADVWWPQAEAIVDPKTKEWRVQVTFGLLQDVGYNFDLAAIVVNHEEHIRLKDYRTKAMISEKWPPIEMPPTLGAPQLRKIKKTSHR